MNKLNELTDDKLVSLYINGNDEAFDVILNRYQSKIFNFILKSVKSQEIAEDIFQDVFVKIIMFLRSGRYNMNDKFQNFAFSIARNLLIDRNRRASVRPIHVSSDNEEYDIHNLKSVAINENREIELIDEQTLKGIEQIITMLSEDQQTIIRMRVYEGLTFKDIAKKLDISINTALGRMRYAISNLRKYADVYGITA